MSLDKKSRFYCTDYFRKIYNPRKDYAYDMLIGNANRICVADTIEDVERNTKLAIERIKDLRDINIKKLKKLEEYLKEDEETDPF